MVYDEIGSQGKKNIARRSNENYEGMHQLTN